MLYLLFDRNHKFPIETNQLLLSVAEQNQNIMYEVTAEGCSELFLFLYTYVKTISARLVD